MLTPYISYASTEAEPPAKSHFEVKIENHGAKANETQVQTVISDVRALDGIEASKTLPPHFLKKTYLQLLSASVDLIEIRIHQNMKDVVASSVFSNDGISKIFLFNGYFDKSPLFRLTVLAHELGHIIYQKDHTECTPQNAELDPLFQKQIGLQHIALSQIPIAGTFGCDDTLHGSTGFEAAFIMSLLHQETSQKPVVRETLLVKLYELYLRLDHASRKEFRNSLRTFHMQEGSDHFIRSF